MNRVKLPREIVSAGYSVERAIEQRRSLRKFSGEKMTLAELSQLLYCAGGVTDEHRGLRAAPSAGATYPIEIYPVVNNVKKLDMGVYRYSVADHYLEMLREGDFREDMSLSALGERMMRHANVVLALSAVFQRTQRHYGERGYRYILFEAGHIAQNIYLEATAMGLGSCAVGAFYDDSFNRILGVDGKEESVLYLMVVGKV